MQMLVNVDVPDVQKGADFYCAAFGLQVGRRFGAHALELTGGSVPIYLLAKAEGSAPLPDGSGSRSYRRHWSPVHLDLVVTDLEAAIARAVAAGAVQERPVKVAAWGKLALFADPFGHGFCLIEFLGRGYDEIADATAACCD